MDQVRNHDSRLKDRVRDLTPDWLKRVLVPFEWELACAAARFCSQWSPGHLLDAAGGSSRYAPGAVGLDRDHVALINREGIRVCADVHHLPLTSESFHAVCCAAALHHFVSPQTALAEFARVTCPGGSLFLSLPDQYPETEQPDDRWRFSRSEISEMLRASCWEIKECRAVGGRWWVRSRRLQDLLFGRLLIRSRILFVLGAPFLGLALPMACFFLDRLDRHKRSTLGWVVVARKAN